MSLFNKVRVSGIVVGMASFLVSGAHSAGAQTLTGLNLFRADSTGNSALNAYASTVGGNNFNEVLYGLSGLPASSLSTTNPFLNSGNFATTPTRIAFNLSTPGTYSYSFLSDTGNNGEISYGTGEVGLNLFFDGNDVKPTISLLAAANGTNAGNFPNFAANSATTTATLNPQVNGGVKGAGTLSFVDGNDLITLTEFRDTTAPVFGADRVGEFALGANGNPDSVMEFRLTVSAIPEPASILALSAGAFVLLGRPRRRAESKAYTNEK